MADGSELALPAFAMDCREWLVVNPADAGELAACPAPQLAMLSTVLIDDDLREARGTLSVGLLEDASELDLRAVEPGADAHELLDTTDEPGSRRYVMPAPGDQGLALLAEFDIGDDVCGQLEQRVERLMGSFRWQSA
jgi:hypothetical protein